MVGAGGSDYTIDHNTVINTALPPTHKTSNVMMLDTRPPKVNNFTFTNNLATPTVYGFFGSGVGEGTAALNANFTNWVFAKNVIVLKGGMKAKERNHAIETLQAVPDRGERVIVATGRYLGEGFDDARLDTLFLTMPISWRGTLAQYAGRLHRLHAAKREVVIYDYVDADEPLLAKMASKREAGYEALGYEVMRSGDLFSPPTDRTRAG